MATLEDDARSSCFWGAGTIADPTPRSLGLFNADPTMRARLLQSWETLPAGVAAIAAYYTCAQDGAAVDSAILTSMRRFLATQVRSARTSHDRANALVFCGRLRLQEALPGVVDCFTDEGLAEEGGTSVEVCGEALWAFRQIAGTDPFPTEFHGDPSNRANYLKDLREFWMIRLELDQVRDR